jgi:alanine dehydrogenase
MRMLGYSEVVAALDFPALVESLRQIFRAGADAPPRHHYQIPVPGKADATLLLMPSWQEGRHIGVKVVAVFPDNPSDVPRLMGSFLLFDGQTGKPLVVMDGPALTARRTAAASALAASYLARPDCERLLMIGTGALASHLIEAHASVRPIVNVLVWGRDNEKAVKLAQRLNRRRLKVTATTDLANAVRGAHVVCCATLSRTPLVEGHWLPLGVHLDLVGGFRPEMREVDDDCIRRGRVFVDTRSGALAEAGDIVQPLRSGILREDDIAGDLFDLARGTRAGRRYHDQITIFKSVGTAIEDLAAARLALDQVVNG